MKAQWITAGLVLVIVGLATADIRACGDKFLVPSRGMRFELKPWVRQAASVLVYVDSTSLQGKFDRASIGPALRKAGYQPTIAASVDELNRTLREGTWDVVVLDLSGGPVFDLPQTADSPVALAFTVDEKAADLSNARKQYATILKTPSRTQAFVDAIDVAVATRRAAQAKLKRSN